MNNVMNSALQGAAQGVMNGNMQNANRRANSAESSLQGWMAAYNKLLPKYNKLLEEFNSRGKLLEEWRESHGELVEIKKMLNAQVKALREDRTGAYNFIEKMSAVIMEMDDAHPILNNPNEVLHQIQQNSKLAMDDALDLFKSGSDADFSRLHSSSGLGESRDLRAERAEGFKLAADNGVETVVDPDAYKEQIMTERAITCATEDRDELLRILPEVQGDYDQKYKAYSDIKSVVDPKLNPIEKEITLRCTKHRKYNDQMYDHRHIKGGSIKKRAMFGKTDIICRSPWSPEIDGKVLGTYKNKKLAKAAIQESKEIYESLEKQGYDNTGIINTLEPQRDALKQELELPLKDYSEARGLLDNYKSKIAELETTLSELQAKLA